MDKITSKTIICSFVYGFNLVVKRRDLWSNLISWGINHENPWLLMGDFNSTLFLEDRSTGVQIANSDQDEFLSCATMLGLQDAYSKGCHFTWTNGTHWAKLDRVLLNPSWNAVKLDCQVDFLQYNTLSDDTPIVISLSKQELTRNKPFRFLNMWMEHPNFQNMVRETWQNAIFGTKQFILCMKLKALKNPLKTLNKQEFNHISERARRAQEAYAEAQNLLMNNPTSTSLQSRAKDFRRTANFLLEAEKNFFKHKLKNTHLLMADRSTSYFHSLVKKKNFNSTIPYLMKADGSYTTSQEEVFKEFTSYFQNLLCNDEPVSDISTDIVNMGPLLSAEESSFLSTPITDEEIKEALFHIGDDKAPSPDGFTAAFFKKNWDILKVDFLRAAHEFFKNGKLLKQFNHAAIALIPKTKHDPQAKDFRPISCCNVFYKTITKIIANKLASVIPSIIDSAQNAFIEDRLMSDNIMLAQQLIRKYGRKTSTPRCMMMIDIRKAFDSISWNFILNLLKSLGFPPSIIGWIRECITSASFSVSLNGKLHGFYKCKRGLRQGDPLSPYLFVLAMEYLSHSFKATIATSNFHYHPKCK